MDDFLQKLKKVVRIGPAISQSDCRKAVPYQFPYDNSRYNHASFQDDSVNFYPQSKMLEL